jgi:hypothetical protein
MEVLEHGWIYNEKHSIIECECGCKYEYNKEDVKEKPQMFFDWDLKWQYCLTYYIECPECEGKNWLSETKPITREEYVKRRELE